MRVLKSLLFSGLILLQSCEFLENTEITDNNQSKTQELNTKKEVPTPPPVAINKAEKDLVTPTIKEEEKKEPEIVDKIEPAKPEKAPFTPELIAAVKNWNAIPRSVFPLPAVTIKKDIKFTAYSQTGQPIASSVHPAGKEVIALAHNGNMLTVAPSKRGTMRGTISMDETDFKDGVAYLFVLRKLQREAYAAKKAKEMELIAKTPSVTRPKPSSPAPIKTQKKEQKSLFEDLPSPGDYGHGKFCICSDCRTKRLAQTGSIK